MLEAGGSLSLVGDGSRVRITLPRARSTQTRILTVACHGAPSSGLLFSAEREQISTVFSTSQWMPALDDPSARATLRLRIVMRREWTGAASGRHVSRRLASADTTRDVHEAMEQASGRDLDAFFDRWIYK